MRRVRLIMVGVFVQSLCNQQASHHYVREGLVQVLQRLSVLRDLPTDIVDSFFNLKGHCEVFLVYVVHLFAFELHEFLF